MNGATTFGSTTTFNSNANFNSNAIFTGIVDFADGGPVWFGGDNSAAIRCIMAKRIKMNFSPNTAYSVTLSNLAFNTNKTYEIIPVIILSNGYAYIGGTSADAITKPTTSKNGSFKFKVSTTAYWAYIIIIQTISTGYSTSM